MKILGVGGLVLCVAVSSLAARAPLDITSDRVRVKQRGAEVEFTGRVVLKRDGGVMTADRLVTREGSADARAWGHVTYTRRADDRLWTVSGDEALYDTDRSSGTLWSVRSRVRATSASAPGAPPAARMDVWARQVTFWIPSHAPPGSPPHVEAVGSVYALAAEPGPTARVTEAWAAALSHEGDRHVVRIAGAYVPVGGVLSPVPAEAWDRPYSRQTAGPDVREVWGEHMTLFLNENRLKVERRASARLMFPLGNTHVPAR